MKYLLTVALLGLFTAGMIGCHADAGVGDDASTSSTSSTTNDGSSYSKKTTTVQTPSGDTSTKTEVRKSNGY
jgi:hypothetical protein